MEARTSRHRTGTYCCLFFAVLAGLALIVPGRCGAIEPVFPDATWVTKTPTDVGLDAATLDAIRDYAEGRGCIVRHGCLVYTWGDATERGDVASAVKPWIAHFLFKAVEDGRISGVDTKVAEFEPRLNDLNAALGYKDRDITFRHMANQISCYGVREAPGTAFDYNDWQMALLFDALFLKVYGATFENVDAMVLHPLLTDVLQCEDEPTFMAFGMDHSAGRLAISPRDFARFGLLYLNKGNWRGRQIIEATHAVMALSSPVPPELPRASREPAEMIAEQRSIGSRKIPDNQCDHMGSYSWLWWVNGIDREGQRYWPDAPLDTFAALGHGDKRGMAVLPGLDIVISWNDTCLAERPLNEVFRLLCQAAGSGSS